MAKKEHMPDVVFIGPARRRQCYKLVVFIVKERDRDGIPRKLEMLLDNESVNIKEGMDFMTAYVPKQMTEPEPDCASGR